MLAVPRREADCPGGGVGGLAVEGERVVAGVEIAVCVDVPVNDLERTGVHLEAVIAKDGVTPERESFFFDGVAHLRDDVAVVADISGIVAGERGNDDVG